MPNNSSNNIKNIYKEDNIDYIKSVNHREKRKNYFYYVNELKHYFDQDNNQQKEVDKNDNFEDNKEMMINSYSQNKDEFFDLNKNKNKLYFNYSNNIYLNNKKSRYSFNPINPDYYNTNYLGNQSKKNNLKQ